MASITFSFNFQKYSEQRKCNKIPLCHFEKKRKAIDKCPLSIISVRSVVLAIILKSYMWHSYDFYCRIYQN